MKKQVKIKRYGSIYNQKQRRRAAAFKKTAATVVLLVVLSAAGWVLYPPVVKLISEVGERISAGVETPPGEASGSSEASAPAEAPETEPQPEPAAALRGIYVPPAVLDDPVAFRTLMESAKQNGINAVMIDAKNAEGEVLYQSGVPMAVSGGAVVSGAYDAAAMAKRISAEGFLPIARVHAFRDPIAPRYSRDAAVGYFDTDWSWLDNSVELGGKPWLNPYSAEARGYITALAKELAESGFERIVVDSVQFPSGVGLDKAGYGETGGISKADCLRSFLKELETGVKSSGAVVSVYFSGPNVLSENESLYGGRPLELVPGSAAVGMMPSSFPKESVFGTVTIADPEADFAATVRAAAAAVRDELSSGTELVALLQANDAAGGALSAVELEKQVRALSESGVEQYILYHPSGSYQLG